MNRIARNWRVLAGGVAAGSVAVMGFTGTSASADPIAPAPPVPAPVTVTQTVTVAPQAADSAAAVPAAPAAAAAQAPAAAAVADPLSAPSAAAQAAATPAVPGAASPLTVGAIPAATTPAVIPAASGTLAEFFKEKGVTLEPQKAAGFTALNIVLPVPTGWTLVPDPNVPDAFTVIADRKGGDALYTPNAALKVYKLLGDFDPREAISHGYVDTQQLTAWQQTDASMAEFGGFPSAEIEGTYREADSMLNTTRRHVIAQSGTDRYLVSLYVTTAANQVVAMSSATEAIIKGFKVADPTRPAPVAASPAPAAPAVAAPVVDAAAPAPAAPAVPAAPAPIAPVAPAPAVVAPAPAPAAAVPAAVPAAVVPLTVPTQ